MFMETKMQQETTTQLLIKTLVDPDKPVNLLSVNHDKMEFVQQLFHRHVALYDNLKFKPVWLLRRYVKLLLLSRNPFGSGACR